MMKPYFIDNYQSNGKIIKKFQPSEMSGAIASMKTIRAAKEAMRGVVEEGTGKSLNKLPYKISGKTGTARMAFPGGGYERNGRRRYQASFAGFFPFENPKYTAIVILYSEPIVGNFYGGTQAGPVFMQIANHLYATSKDWDKPLSGKDYTLDTLSLEKGIPAISTGRASADNTVLSVIPVKNKKQLLSDLKNRDWVSVSKQDNAINVNNCNINGSGLVNVVGMGIKDAVYILENRGYKVNFKGFGRVVSQTPEPGSVTDKNTTIVLTLENSEI